MTPEQLLTQLSPKGGGRFAPTYLFLGPEMHQRDQCRTALLDAVLGVGEREGYFTYDLEETPMAAICDDAAAYSLFTQRRVFWISRAEAALPRGKAAAAAAAASDDGDDDSPGSSSGKPGAAAADALSRYLKNPSQDTVLVFDSHKFEFDGEDKTKTERLRKLYAAIPAVVEFPRWTAAMARKLAQDRVRELGLEIAADDLTLLVDAVAASPSRVLVELEKLSLYARTAARPGKVTAADIAALVPQAQATTVFALVAALGRGERQKALSLLDVLIREGEYLPLALSFLATQFRQALVAQEAQLRGAGQIVAHFARLGVPMWPSRAEQIAQTMTSFTPQQLKRALGRIAAADKGLRDIRPDDRTVLEDFILALTAPSSATPTARFGA